MRASGAPGEKRERDGRGDNIQEEDREKKHEREGGARLLLSAFTNGNCAFGKFWGTRGGPARLASFGGRRGDQPFGKFTWTQGESAVWQVLGDASGIS